MERLADGRRAGAPIGGLESRGRLHRPGGPAPLARPRRSRLLPVPARGRLGSQSRDRRLGGPRRAGPSRSRRTRSPSRPVPARPRPVGPGRRAGARVVYRVLASRFHDETKLDATDLLYALGLAWRTQDPAVMRATARLRERLVALRVLRTETDVLAFGEDKLTYEVPIVEVFVDRPAATRRRHGPDRAAVDDRALARAGPRRGGGRRGPRGLLAGERPGARRRRGSTSRATARSRRVSARFSTSWPRAGTCRPRSPAGSRRRRPRRGGRRSARSTTRRGTSSSRTARTGWRAGPTTRASFRCSGTSPIPAGSGSSTATRSGSAPS